MANVADPLGGSLLRRGPHRRGRAPGRGDLRPPRRARRRARSSRACIRGIEENWFQGKIADSAYELERKFNADRRIDHRRQPLHRGQRRELDRHPADHQRGRGPPDQAARRRAPATGTSAAVAAALDRLAREAADPEVNLMPTLDRRRQDVRDARRDHGHAGRRLRAPRRGAHDLTGDLHQPHAAGCRPGRRSPGGKRWTIRPSCRRGSPRSWPSRSPTRPTSRSRPTR